MTKRECLENHLTCVLRREALCEKRLEGCPSFDGDRSFSDRRTYHYLYVF